MERRLDAPAPKPKAENSGWRQQLRSLKNLGPFFAMIWQTNPWLAAASVLLRLIKAVLPTAMLYVGKLIVDEVLAILAGAGEATFLWQMVGLELAIALLSNLLMRAIQLADALLGDLVAIHTSVEIMEHAAQLDLFHFEDADFYDKLERARRQTRGRATLLAQVLGQLQDLVTIAALAAGVLAFSPWLIALVAVAVIPSFLQENYFNQQSYSLTRSWTPERRELDYLRYIGASDTTAKEIKIFGLAEFITERFKELSFKYYAANRVLSIRRAAWGALFAAFSAMAYYGAYVYIIWQTIGAVITVGTLTFLAGAFKGIQSSLQAFLSRFASITNEALYLQDLYDFLALKPAIFSSATAIPFPEKVQEGWEFRNVTFRYPNAEKDALADLSFFLPAGQKLALVGENGAGKTTLIKLLTRLYEPTSGRILLDGIDLREYDLGSLRDRVGVIFQDFFRYQLTAAENIAIGRISERENHRLIKESATKSLASEVIEELPKGYEQLLGKRFSEGLDLSGGQWQKIALARAYMRDAQLLVLDEPTSALDARAEYEVFQRFSALIQDKTAVLISHRFSTVRMADIILFIEHGQLLEMGSHADLLAVGGRYAELFHLQAQGYK